MNKVYCFGNTENGELGLGGIEEEHILTPRKQRLPYDRRKYLLIQLSSGRNHTLLLMKNIQLDQNFIFSCGCNDRLQLGRDGSWKKLEQVDGLRHHNIVKISCGFNNCLALSDAGQLFSWGCNLFGQLGLCSREEHEIGKPSLIKSLATKQIVQICCGGNHCLALTKNGEVFSWGSNAFGQLGLGSAGNCLSKPSLLTSLQWTPIRQIVAGGSHSAVLSYTGALYVWGKNEFGQLGLSDTNNRTLPTLQRSLRSQKIAYISMGDEHSAALTFEGGLFTWGAGMYGQLGHGRTTNEILPRKVFELMGTHIIQVSCGRCHTLAVSKLGRVFSFGLNGSGQLGIGSNIAKTLPATVRGPWSEINTKDVILRDYENSLQLVDPIGYSEGEFNKSYVIPNEQTEPKQNVPSKNLDLSDMEINEMDDSDENESIDDQTFIIEEPDEKQNEESYKRPEFICADDGVFQQNPQVEIDEYETDPDSDCEDGSVKSQYIIKEIVAGKGDHSFVIAQPFIEKATIKDFRRYVPEDEILKFQNNIFEQLQYISKESIPLEIVDYIESVFSSIPAINASYLSRSENEYGDYRKRIQKFKNQEEIYIEEPVDFIDGWINWQQAFHGFNVIEDAQNERINDLIQQFLLKTLNNMPDLAFSSNVKKHEFPDILDDEVMRVYQILPLFHMFKMPEQYQNLITAYAKSIRKLSSRGINCLKIWWCKMNPRFFKNLVEIFKNSIKVNLLVQKNDNEEFDNLSGIYYFLEPINNNLQQRLQSVNYNLHYNLALCLEMLKLLYSVNKVMEKISYKEFYIDGISEMFDLKLDYYLWKRNLYMATKPKQYFLCDFPFIFDSPAKNVILAIDSNYQQRHAANRSIRKQMLSSVNGLVVMNPFLKIEVRRDSILQDTINQLTLFSTFEEADLKKHLKVVFQGEEAVDAGQGMKKEYFLLVMKEILDQKYGLFIEYPETATIWFNHAMIDDDENMYKVIGILCGLAIYNWVIIDLPFPLVLYKMILNENLELEDLADLDPVLTKNLTDILHTSYDRDEFNAIFGEMNFVITLQAFGTPMEYELCPDGKSRVLNYDNREEYVQLYWKFILINSIEKLFNSFKDGFKKILNDDILQIFQAEELMQLVEGEEVINWEDLENSTKYKEPFTKDHPTIRTFWKVFNNFPHREKKKFLKFLTGSDRIPITGIKTLNLIIQPMDVSEEHLPVAHTCFNILDLPLNYPSEDREEKMRSKLLKASELAVEFALV